MRRTILTGLFLLSLLIPAHASQRLLSIQPLMWAGSNHCTTFSINEAKGYWSTAFHCVHASNAMEIAGQPATIFMENKDNDTAVLVSEAHAQRLRLAPFAPSPNAGIKCQGHPFGIVGFQTPFITTQGVFLTTFVDEDGIWNLYDLSAGGGNSGSPVSSKQGVIGTLNFGWPNGGRLGGGTIWAALKTLVDMGVWED